MNKLKLLFIITLSALFMFVGCGKESEDKKEFIYKEFECEENEDGTICITEYNGNESVVTLPSEIDGKTVREIASCFLGNETVTEVIIPDTIVNIDVGAFWRATNLTTISGGKNVERIGYEAFAGCSSLKTLPPFPELIEIDDSAFTDCSSLESIPDAPNLKIIGDISFMGCTGIKKVELPEGLERIGRSAFGSASGLEKVVLPQSIIEIGANAFRDTPWLESQGENAMVLDGFLLSCERGREEIRIPKGTKHICVKLYRKYKDNVTKKIYIPDTVEDIGELGMDQESDITVYIPPSVRYIGEFDAMRNPDENRLLFIVEEGSYAEKYAKENGITYKTVENVQEIYDSTLSAYESTGEEENTEAEVEESSDE